MSAIPSYDPAHDPEALLSPKQAGAMIGLTERKLSADRNRGVGIPYIRLGANRVRYRRGDILTWIERLRSAQNGSRG